MQQAARVRLKFSSFLVASFVLFGAPMPSMRSALILTVALALPLAVAGCDNQSSTAATTSTTQTLATDVLLGSVPAPVNGVLQSGSNPFTVGQGGGTVSVTLTSAVETLPGGALLPTVVMGLGIGTPTGLTCTIISGGSTTAQGGSSPQLSGSLNAGSYCVQVSDVTSQVGPVAYAVAVSHP